MTAIDPADFNVMSGAYKSIAQEMQDIMLRAAYSSLVREAKDCSTCVCLLYTSPSPRDRG